MRVFRKSFYKVQTGEGKYYPLDPDLYQSKPEKVFEFQNMNVKDTI